MRHCPPRPSALRAALVLCCAALALCGCFVPEHYIARIKIEPDGGYKLYVEGTAVHAAARRALAGAKGPAVKKEDQEKRLAQAQELLMKDLDKARADKRVLNIGAIGEGRVRFSFDGAWRMDLDALIVEGADEPISYSKTPDGTWRLYVRAAAPSREAKHLGVKTEGSLAIVLAPGIEVLEHNARRTPTSPGGAYRWSIDDATAEPPYLRIRLPDPARLLSPRPQGQQKGLAHH